MAKLKLQEEVENGMVVKIAEVSVGVITMEANLATILGMKLEDLNPDHQKGYDDKLDEIEKALNYSKLYLKNLKSASDKIEV